MRRAGLRPPGAHSEWTDALAGDLYLYFETGLSSPRAYREYLLEHLDERSPIPYIREAAGRAGVRLEGATQVDALVIAPDTGVGILIEAKVLSDCSATVSYDVLRNQVARNIDVMLNGIRRCRLRCRRGNQNSHHSCFSRLSFFESTRKVDSTDG